MILLFSRTKFSCVTQVILQQIILCWQNVACPFVVVQWFGPLHWVGDEAGLQVHTHSNRAIINKLHFFSLRFTNWTLDTSWNGRSQECSIVFYYMYAPWGPQPGNLLWEDCAPLCVINMDLFER